MAYTDIVRTLDIGLTRQCSRMILLALILQRIYCKKHPIFIC